MASENAAREPKRRRGVWYRLGRLGVFVGIALMVARLSGCVESLAYFPSRDEFSTPPGVEDVWFESADGTRLHGWFMPGEGVEAGEPGPAVLHVHGNAGNVSSHASFSRFLTVEGIGVLVFDYRKYGRSEDRGPLRRRALLADTEAALAALKARADVDASRVGVYGVSLGGGFGLHAAAGDADVRAVVTVSAFSSWAGVAHDMAPVLGPLLMRGGVDGADAAARLGDRPYLIVHGLADEIIDPRHAEVLAEAARSGGVDSEVWTDPRGDHNTMMQTSAEARRRVSAFFREHLGVGEGR